MALLNLQSLRAMRPNWCVIEQAEPIALAPGESIAPHISDANQVYFILEGRLKTFEAGEELEAESGDVLVVRAGTRHGFSDVSEAAMILRINDLPQPPFRDGRSREGDTVPIALPPCEPFASPKRRGASASFDASSTFSPELLAETTGGDLLLYCNPGAMSPGQLEEIRRHCVETCRAIGALIVPIEDDDIDDYFRDPFLGGYALRMRPHSVGVEADLKTAEGRERLTRLRAKWHRTLHVDGVRPAVSMALQKWSESELREIFGLLATIPPTEVSLILRWDPAEFDSSPLGRMALETLLPWTGGVEYVGTSGIDEAAHYLDAHGFQGCVYQKK